MHRLADPTGIPPPLAENRRPTPLQIGVLLGPVFVFLAAIAPAAVNVPRDDDLQSILPFLNAWGDASGAARSHLLCEQYYSHRIVVTRLAAVVAQALAPNGVYLSLQICGWLLWLGLVAGLLFTSAAVRRHSILGLPVVLVLLHPQGFTNFHVAMQAIQNLGVVALAFAALRLATMRSQISFAASLALAAVAVFTSVNGLLAPPLIAVAFAAEQNWRRTGCAIGLTIGTWALFFRDYGSSNIGSMPRRF